MAAIIGDINWLYDSLVSKANKNLSLNSDKKIKWMCSKCSKSWLESVKTRLTHIECNNCSKITIIPIIENKPQIILNKFKVDQTGVKSGMCDDPNCQKHASFGYKEDGKKIRCSEHKDILMVSLGRKLCNSENCGKDARFNFSGQSKLLCAEHKEVGMIAIGKQTCLGDNCFIDPKFNYDGEKSGIYCREHSLPGMIDVKNKLCIGDNCTTRPTFCLPGETRAKYCKKHSTSEMISVGKKKCIYPGCLLVPSFNMPGEKIPLYCSKHKESDEMINVTKRKCKEPNCGRIPTFNYPGEKYGIYCSFHELKGMYNIVDKMCKNENCWIRPTYNYPGEKSPIYCMNCSLPGMIDVKNIKCADADCKTQATYNYFGQSKKWCKKHAPSGTVGRPRPKCKEGGCFALANYGIKQPTHCQFHSEPDEKDLYSKPCVKCTFKMIVDENGVCYYCDPKSSLIVLHAKENRVKEFLDARGYKYLSHDKIIEKGSCGKERPDFLFDCGYFFLILECDENQHGTSSYQCERTRMFNIAQSLGLKTIFIRYNPDKYKKPHQNKREDNESHNTRMEKLSEWINLCMSQGPTELVVCIYLFYDGYDGTYKIELMNTPEDIERLNQNNVIPA